jgi:hypothetical protein
MSDAVIWRAEYLTTPMADFIFVSEVRKYRLFLAPEVEDLSFIKIAT